MKSVEKEKAKENETTNEDDNCGVRLPQLRGMGVDEPRRAPDGQPLTGK